MTILILILISITFLITTALAASRLTQKIPKVKRKGDTTKDPKSLSLYQDYLKQQGLTGNLTGTIDPVVLSRIRNSFAGSATERPLNRKVSKPVGNPQAPSNRTTNGYTRDEDSYTSVYDINYALALGYNMNASRSNHSDPRTNHNYNHDSGSSHSDSSHNNHDNSSYDSGCHDSGCHDSGCYDSWGHDSGSYGSGSHDCGGGDF